MKGIFLIFLLTVCQIAVAQPRFHVDSTVIIEKDSSRLVVPITIQVANNADLTDSLILTIDSAKLPGFTISKASKAINKKIKTVTFYVILGKEFKYTNINVKLTFSLMNQVKTKKIILAVRPQPNLIYTLSDYIDEHELRLQKVTRVESQDNVLSIYGYHTNNNKKVIRRQVVLKQGEIYGIKQSFKPTLSLITVPFKIRPKYEADKLNVQSGLTNIGLNVSLTGRQWDRYKSDASKVNYKFAVGVWAAPSVEELSLDNIKDKSALLAGEKNKQMLVSTGLTLTYSYNSLSFVFVPLGIDIPTSKLGKEWIYSKRVWWGFGIAIEPKFFASILNK